MGTFCCAIRDFPAPPIGVMSGVIPKPTRGVCVTALLVGVSSQRERERLGAEFEKRKKKILKKKQLLQTLLESVELATGVSSQRLRLRTGVASVEEDDEPATGVSSHLLREDDVVAAAGSSGWLHCDFFSGFFSPATASSQRRFLLSLSEAAATGAGAGAVRPFSSISLCFSLILRTTFLFFLGWAGNSEFNFKNYFYNEPAAHVRAPGPA